MILFRTKNEVHNKIVPRKNNSKKLIINIETESDNDMESKTEPETEPDTETESLSYGE